MVEFRDGMGWNIGTDRNKLPVFVLNGMVFDSRDPLVSVKRTESQVSGYQVSDIELVKKDAQNRETQYAKLELSEGYGSVQGQLHDVRQMNYGKDGKIESLDHKHYINNRLYSRSEKSFDRKSPDTEVTHGSYMTDYGQIRLKTDSVSHWRNATEKEVNNMIWTDEGKLAHAERKLECYEDDRQRLKGVYFDEKRYNPQTGYVLSEKSSYIGNEAANYESKRDYDLQGRLRKERSQSKIPGTETMFTLEKDLVQSRSGMLMYDQRNRRVGPTGEIFSEDCELTRASDGKSLWEHHISPGKNQNCIQDRYGFHGGDARVVKDSIELMLPVESKWGKISVPNLNRSFDNTLHTRSYGEKVSDRFSSLLNRVKGVDEPEYPF